MSDATRFPTTNKQCHNCSRPRIYMIRDARTEPRVQLDCPLHRNAPRALGCDQFEREPGADDWMGDREIVEIGNEAWLRLRGK